MLYSQRIYGDSIRTNENLSFTFWKKLVEIFETMYEKNYFSKSYPIRYPMYNYSDEFDDYMDKTRYLDGQVYECDFTRLNEDIIFYITNQLGWPLKTSRITHMNHVEDNKSSTKIEDWQPKLNFVFDLIEFLYKKTNTAQVHTVEDQYDEKIGEYLRFPKNNRAKDSFIEKINTLFSDAKLIYVFDSELEEIRTILPATTRQLIENTLNQKKFCFTPEYHQMLQNACDLISSRNFELRYDSLHKLWDAFECLKCYYSSNKRTSSDQITGLFDHNPGFAKLVKSEMRDLTEFGNTFKIRHSEPHQEKLTDSRQINYLFNRCLVIIHLIQEQIATESIKN